MYIYRKILQMLIFIWLYLYEVDKSTTFICIFPVLKKKFFCSILLSDMIIETIGPFR